MKFATKKSPFHLKGKSTACFCLFPKVKSGYGPGKSPVYLNVYDLTPMNGYAYWAGVGIFHSGVEVHGVEYAFGAHDYPSSGVFEVEPRQCPGFKFRRSILIGTTCLDPVQVREFMEHHAANYYGDKYHLIVKNCNHFCNDICYHLTGKWIPGWVNRLAKLGSIFSCVLPEALRITAVQHDPSLIPYEHEKQKLRSNSFSFLSFEAETVIGFFFAFTIAIKGMFKAVGVEAIQNRCDGRVNCIIMDEFGCLNLVC